MLRQAAGARSAGPPPPLLPPRAPAPPPTRPGRLSVAAGEADSIEAIH